MFMYGQYLLILFNFTFGSHAQRLYAALRRRPGNLNVPGPGAALRADSDQSRLND